MDQKATMGRDRHSGEERRIDFNDITVKNDVQLEDGGLSSGSRKAYNPGGSTRMVNIQNLDGIAQY